MDLDIKDCPFCDGKGSVVCSDKLTVVFKNKSDVKKYQTICFLCGASSGQRISYELAVKAWNKGDGMDDTQFE